LADIASEKKVIVFVGAGGVGKTTCAAAMAIIGAMIGKKTLVFTIDPARRLANSLGLPYLGNEPVRIDPELFENAGIKCKGELYGMMVDTKRSFDELIERIAPSKETLDQILQNRYYQNLSSALAGSQEYIATEKMYEIHSSGRFDLIVLDTPPTRHALDFLDAPRRVTEFLDGRVVQWFVKPYLFAGKLGFKFAIPSATIIFRILEKFTGYEVLADLTEFFLHFENMYDGFKIRAQFVKEMLGNRNITSFVLVTTPSQSALEEASFFRDRLISFGMPLGGFCINRIMPNPWPVDRNELSKRIHEVARMPRHLSSKRIKEIENISQNLLDLVSLAEAEESAIREFAAVADQNMPLAKIPLFTNDVHDLSGLAQLAGYFREEGKNNHGDRKSFS